MSVLFEPLTFSRGPSWRNRFALAPMTNCASHDDGTLSEDEYRWLTMRADGGFGMVMTCASHVQAVGQGFPGQLGCFSDEHLEGLRRLASGIRGFGAVSSLQLHHAGLRAPSELIGQQPVGPSEDLETGSRALSESEVLGLVDDFVQAAVRADAAGFDGVEIHGAHGYILCAFLSSATNRRVDDWGGSPRNRQRIIESILDGIRSRCRADFQVGLRLSPEKHGLDSGEMLDFSARMLTDGRLDFLDMSLWDFRKHAEDERLTGDLASHFAALDRDGVRLGVAGKIWTGRDAREAMDLGLDFVSVGRSAILHHDWPKRLFADGEAVPRELPVAPGCLSSEGLGPAFIAYMGRWPGFVDTGKG